MRRILALLLLAACSEEPHVRVCVAGACIELRDTCSPGELDCFDPHWDITIKEFDQRVTLYRCMNDGTCC